jgi:lipopolysaccharide transport system permease protein
MNTAVRTPSTMRLLSELFRYRNLLVELVLSELRLRYRRSVLGFLWTLLNPLLMMLVLTLVFSTVMRFAVKDYAILLFCGLLPWIFFSQSVNLSLMSIVGKGPLLKKVYMPKVVIPLSAVIATFVNFSLSLVPLSLILLALGHRVGVSVAFVPVAMFMLAAFTAGVSLLFACLNVFFRDFTHMTEVVLQAWFYASPVIYTIDMIPEAYRPAFAWNPVVYLVECFRAPIFAGQLPAANTIALAAGSSVAALVLGLFVFSRYEHQFVHKV